MGKVVLALVIGGFALMIGMAIFPSVKNILAGNSTTGFSYLLSAGYASLKYIFVIFIFLAVWWAIKRRGK